MHIGNNWYTGVAIGWVTALAFYLFRKAIHALMDSEWAKARGWVHRKTE